MSKAINRGHCAVHSHDCPSDCPDRLGLAIDLEEERNTPELDGPARRGCFGRPVSAPPRRAGFVPNWATFDALAAATARGTMDEDSEVEEVERAADARDDARLRMPRVDGFPED